jgi:hypothetical protein
MVFLGCWLNSKLYVAGAGQRPIMKLLGRLLPLLSHAALILPGEAPAISLQRRVPMPGVKMGASAVRGAQAPKISWVDREVEGLRGPLVRGA